MMDFDGFKRKFIRVQEELQQSTVCVTLTCGGYIFANGFAQSYEAGNEVVLLLHDRFIIAEIPLSSISDIKPR